MANLVTFHIQKQRDLTLKDFIDFLKRTIWKLHQTAKRKTHVEKFLKTIDTDRAHIRLRNECEEGNATQIVAVLLV